MERREFLKTAGLAAGAAALPGLAGLRHARAADGGAKWIWTSDRAGDRPNAWACFRRTFRLEERPESAPARIAADSRYWLWVNGRPAVREGALKRGPTPSSTYCDTVELAPYLQSGDNTIAVLAWYFGKDGFSHKDSGRAGLFFRLDVAGRVVGSDSGWRAIVHPAFGDTGDPKPNYRLPESNLRFDAGKAIGRWPRPDFDDADWPRAAERGAPPDPPWGPLEPRPTPQWEDYGLRKYENAAELPDVSDGEPIVAVLPYNAHVTPYLEVKAPAGRTIDVRTDHYRIGSERSVRAEYVTRDGVQAHETPGWLNGHKVIYRIPKGVEIRALKYRESGYDTEFAGRIECSDEFYNRLCRKAVRTLYVTMRDTFMDCPDRERAQWWGDMVIQLGQTFYALDRSADSLIRKGIRELMRWQRDDGTIYAPVPAGNWDKELPLQMLASVGYYGFWTYYRYSGDAETIRELYPRVRRYVLGVWSLKNDGLVGQRKGGWTWLDWGQNKDAAVLYNGWYYLALKGLRGMAKLCGRREDLREIDRRMKTVRGKFNSTFWTGEAYNSPAHDGPPDDRAQGLAVVAGLADESMYDAIAQVLAEQHYASPYMEKYVLEALYRMGRPEQALSRMKERYRPMVENDLTTLCEQFPEGGSHNHSWTGGPLTLLYQYGAGVEPLEPGFRRFRVRPRPGSLESIETEFPSAAGRIAVAVRRTDGRLRLDVDVPSGTTARVEVPAAHADSVLLDGAETEQQGSSRNRPEFLGPQDGFMVFRAGPGRWKFRADRR